MFSSAEFIGAEPVQRATWIALLAWCCEQENGGIIHECRSWGMRRWMQTCGVTQEEIGEGCELYSWDGNNLMVFGYPKHIQANLEVKRTIARENGKLGGRPRKTNVGTDIETNVETDEKPMSVSKKTDVGTNVETEIGTNIETDIATYGKTVRKEGREERNNITTTTTTPARSDVDPWPSSVDEVERYMAAQVMKPSDGQLPICAQKFYDEMEAVGWKNKKGIPLANWMPLARQYAANWMRNEGQDMANGLRQPKKQGNVRMDTNDLGIKWE
ncbi:hypothetical protein QET40_06780 [Akkermansia sp. N21169]|uniref:hypothetical protein n=1 Tax=Akkermansia sp. N21169 TaxID=3040765 RepID=UPI00244E7B3A|nr:hypothetical protein [Akkermansia sp. N21169]MDH3068819.1 hypothetical protein [Akkermansia sp. N21169]